MERVNASTTIAFIYDGRYYKRIVEHLNIAGYLGEADPDFDEANVGNLVHGITSPIVNLMWQEMGRMLRLTREKEIISRDGKTGGTEGRREDFMVFIRVDH